ncbi:hypothetical protein BT67DRAFT_184674 [Trichocladium antarcticum]|uniref:Uncharacterized protein n=1 Tax=Trichocladium antarcticum TaxID=1450529 RepID=A0AAN6UP33_9PEZI|nr:hypothetical protein BT67DRAFT_184674 [Trichocladium antarcticum]
MACWRASCGSSRFSSFPPSRAPPPHTQCHPAVVWDVHDCRVFFSIMMLAPTGLDWLAGPPIRGQPRVMHAETHACGFAQQKSILMVGGLHMTDNFFHTYIHGGQDAKGCCFPCPGCQGLKGRLIRPVDVDVYLVVRGMEEIDAIPWEKAFGMQAKAARRRRQYGTRDGGSWEMKTAEGER